jgi:alcohol dehydrogenase
MNAALLLASNPVPVTFGAGVRSRLVCALEEGESFALLCSKSGRKRIESDAAFAELIRTPHLIWFDEIGSYPDIAVLREQIDRLRGLRPQAIVAIGGGSVVDSSKVAAVALGVRAPDVLDLLFRSPESLDIVQPLPLHVCPTTAGTGSEVTPFATIWDWHNRKKLSLVGRAVFPQTAVVDPELTSTVPQLAAIIAGLDAVNQAMESLWNRRATPETMVLAMEAVALGLDALPRLLHDSGEGAREAMVKCSLLAGLAISETRTALCHSMSYPLTCHFGMPHGLACAFTMLSVFRLNRTYDDGRFGTLAAFLKLSDVDALERRLAAFVEDLRVAERVRAYLPSAEDIKNLVPEMITTSRADNNVVPVDASVVFQVLESSYKRTGTDPVVWPSSEGRIRWPKWDPYG